MSNLLNGAIMTIFAREILEGVVIIGQYRTVLHRSPEWQDPDKQKAGLKAINMAALMASLVAVVVCACVAIPLAVLSKDLDEKTADIIEGVSKLVAAVCVLQLSLKIPKFLGVYASKKGEDGVTVGLSLKSIRFNVAWNVWREVAEIGVFLIPFFLQGAGAKAIPLSGIIGIAVGFALGAIIYFANHKLNNTAWLAAFMALLLLFLSVGLFVGGCHEFEEVYGETDKIYNIGVKRSLFEEEEETRYLSHSERFLTAVDEEAKPEYTFWSEKKLPMALLKPFGYSAGRTQLQIACFWSWLVFGIVLHAWKYVSSKKIREAQDFNEAEEGAAAHGNDLELQETEAGGKGSQGTDEENVSAEDVEADVA
ncbi:Ftr1_plasma membrane iron permease [Thalassiosira pseudonana CCMP1335]|uniref:Ftr1_plasma membrane iron permease n=1 Tax=Thalassiosira pseudonana TaxID=35128 RepID=B8BQL6_THAPS|nr:Ftr1_plasma membrane iron permease [Thalassiosira pseudonana CCMP1335]EED95805.1 Ftr1_plasma membrane iron permease [Thalassiosira pseudonana CCMP1335]